MKTTRNKTVQQRGAGRDKPRTTMRKTAPAARKRAPVATARTSEPPAAAPPPAPSTPALASPIPDAPERPIALSVPEPAFAAAAPPAEPERAMPAGRRAIFFDVENTSRAEHLARVIDHLGVDRLGRRVDFVAVGNWKVVGHDSARLLARHGAQLVHSAPSVGVRDWSDLRIAVSAGVWLAAARPGDQIDIISDDRAFDAVGDVAASLGIAYRRLSYRQLMGMRDAPPVHEPAPVHERAPMPRPGRRRRGRRYTPRDHAPVPRPSAPTPAPAAITPPPVQPSIDGGGAGADMGEAHTAPHDEIISVARELIGSSPSGSVTIDMLANALKGRGFRRTPGSPRLITRLRRIKELTINRSGLITLVDGGRHLDVAPPAPPAPMPEATDRQDDDEGTEAPGHDEPDGNVALPAPPGQPPRRRSRRGGRRRRGRGRGPQEAKVEPAVP